MARNKPNPVEPQTFPARTRADGVAIGYEGFAAATLKDGLGELILMAPTQAALEQAWEALGLPSGPIIRPVAIFHPAAIQEGSHAPL